ncbi:MAG: hypothetical protein ACE14S_01030 [Candidatus Bathyarchaeia archaeon]
MAIKKTSIAAIAALTIAALILTVTSAAVLNSSQTLHSQGSVTPIVQTNPNIGVYSDSACTQNATSLDWGTLSPGGVTTKTVWVKNSGTANATLSMTTTNWSPAGASQYISLSWDRTGKVLAPNEVVQATLTLTVSASVTGITTFSFDVVITGTG